MVVLGSAKFLRCLKGKKGYKFTVEESGESEVAEAELQGKKSLITSLKKVLSSPIQLLRKCKDLSLEAIDEIALFLASEIAKLHNSSQL